MFWLRCWRRWILGMMNPCGLWDAEFDSHFPCAICPICLDGLEHGLGIHDFKRTWSSRFLQPERNFFDSLVLVSNAPSLFTWMFFVASATLEPSSISRNVKSWIILRCWNICSAIRSHTVWSNAQHVSATTTTILPTTASTNYGFTALVNWYKV